MTNTPQDDPNTRAHAKLEKVRHARDEYRAQVYMLTERAARDNAVIKGLIQMLRKKAEHAEQEAACKSRGGELELVVGHQAAYEDAANMLEGAWGILVEQWDGRERRGGMSGGVGVEGPW